MITVKNTGCGLGDMLGRIDLIYRLCQKYGLEFCMPDISSNLHSKNYGDEIGFNKFKPNRLDWKGAVIVVPLIDFVDADKVSLLTVNANVLYEVSFDHAVSRQVSDSLGLQCFKSLNYDGLLSIVDRNEEIDYLVHLRLGDNYLYHIDSDLYLDAGRRRIVRLSDPGVEQLVQDQWKINEVSALIKYFDSKGLKYRFLSDGVQSAIRHINWTKTDAYLDIKDKLLDSVNSFNEIFNLNFGANKNFFVGSDDILFAINSLRSSKNVVCTVGGFMRHTNKYLNSSSCKVIQFSSILGSIKL